MEITFFFLNPCQSYLTMDQVRNHLTNNERSILASVVEERAENYGKSYNRGVERVFLGPRGRCSSTLDQYIEVKFKGDSLRSIPPGFLSTLFNPSRKNKKASPTLF